MLETRHLLLQKDTTLAAFQAGRMPLLLHGAQVKLVDDSDLTASADRRQFGRLGSVQVLFAAATLVVVLLLVLLVLLQSLLTIPVAVGISHPFAAHLLRFVAVSLKKKRGEKKFSTSKSSSPFFPLLFN